MNNRTTMLTEKFFTDLFPRILYSDTEGDILNRLIEEQGEFVHGLVDAYFSRMDTKSPYEVSNFYVDGTLVNDIAIVRVQLKGRLATTIKRAYLVCQMDENHNKSNKRYYVTVTGFKRQGRCRCIEENGFCKSLGQTIDLDEEAKLILDEFSDHYKLFGEL